MESFISTRIVRDIVIVDMNGGLREGASARALHDEVRRLLDSNAKKVALNLRNVPYADSTGIGELVSAMTAAEKVGSRLTLLSPSQSIHSLLQITKLSTVVQVWSDEELALQAFDTAGQYCKCPPCGNLSRPPCLDNNLTTSTRWTDQLCPVCGVRFSQDWKREVDTKGRRFPLGNLKVPTYEDEYFSVVAGPPFQVFIHGRLNLFSSSALGSVWSTIPEPRRIIFDLRSAAKIDVPGFEALLGLLSAAEQTAKTYVCVASISQLLSAKSVLSERVVETPEAALEAMGDVSDTPDWMGNVVERTPVHGG